MLGHGEGAVHVKCEPPSDEDENPQQLADLFFTKFSPGFRSINAAKLESNRDNQELHTSTSLLETLQSPRLEELGPLTPAGPAATPVCVKTEPAAGDSSLMLETLESTPHVTGSFLLERHLAMLSSTELADSTDFMPLQSVKDEPSSEGEQRQVSSTSDADADETSDSCGMSERARASPKSWSQRDMDNALDALRNHNMSLTKASARYRIPSTTLWQRAHRLGIDTPKKEGTSKSWSDEDLRAALNALRAGALSANKASKAYGIPSSTLYKIARREGIRLAAPFNAAPVAWRRCDLPRALAAIRAGAAVQRAAIHYNIPTGTLYGRCKREGIELSRSNPTPWSEDAMGEALEAVRGGQMSINQAAIHYNLPYSSLYGRFKRCKYQDQQIPQEQHQPSDKPSQSEPPYHDTTPPYHDTTPPYHDTTPPYHDTTPPYHDTTPPYHDTTPPYHDTTPPYQYQDIQDYSMYYQGLTTNQGFNGITTS